MTVIVDIDHEAGNLNEYDSTETDSGDLSVAGGAALVGSYGLSFVVDDTNEMYGRANVSAPGSGDFRWRFYVDPNGITVGGSDKIVLSRLHSSGPSYTVALARLEHDGSSYEITTRVYEDDGSYSGADHDISDGVHYVELYVVQASSDVAGDGTFQSWIDGVAKDDISGLDNYDVFSNMDWLSLQCADPGTASGTYYLDDLVANDDGSEIGAADAVTPGFQLLWEVGLNMGSVPAAGELSIPVAMYDYRRRRV